MTIQTVETLNLTDLSHQAPVGAIEAPSNMSLGFYINAYNVDEFVAEVISDFNIENMTDELTSVFFWFD